MARNLEAEVEAMLGIQAGITVVLASLMAKHPDYEQFQLHLASMVEIADAGSLWRALKPAQREQARAYVELLQQIRAAPGEIRPLG